MNDQDIGWGLASLAAMALLCVAAIAAWAYRAHELTSRTVAQWPDLAQIDHTAPWSVPWSDLCRLDDDGARWCRSLPDGAHIEHAAERADGVHVQLDTYEWVLDARDGHTISPLPR